MEPWVLEVEKEERIENRFINILVYKQSFHITVHILSCSNQSLAYSTVNLVYQTNL